MNTKKKSVWMVPMMVLFCLAAGAVFLLLTSCQNGGAGADFDATQYYTKTEVDGNFYSKTEIDAVISDVSPLSGDGDPQWLSSTAGYANKTAGVVPLSGCDNQRAGYRINFHGAPLIE